MARQRQARGRELTVKDHTKLIEFLIKNRSQLKPARGRVRGAALLKQAAAVAPPTEAALFQRVAAATPAHERTLRNLKMSDPVAQEAISVLAKVFAADNVVAMLRVLRAEERKRHSVAVKTGITTAREMLEDGAATIYSPEFWIAQVVDPRGYYGAAARGMQRAAEQLGAKAAAVAAADVGGAIGGAVSGAIGGVIRGGARGAARGAAQGAVEGAAGASASETLQ